MTYRPIDQYAISIPKGSGLLPCLYIPIAARDTSAIEKYVGRIVAELTPRSLGKALLIEAYEPEEPDRRLPIWNHPEMEVLHKTRQVWVAVNYNAYRKAYPVAFPADNLTHFVLDHIMNRRLARLKGFEYIRIVPISKSANSSHGRQNEDWGVKYHSSPEMVKINKASKASVQYADLADIVKMLNITGGGSFMQNVNDAQFLVDLPKEAQ